MQIPSPWNPGAVYTVRLVNGVGIVVEQNPQRWVDHIVSVFVVEPFEVIVGSIEVAKLVQPRLL